MSSLDSLAQPEDQSTSVDISATQPPPPIGSDYEQLQMLETWLIIHPYREQRRFLEEFPAILNPRSEDLIKNTLTLESAGVPGQIQELHDHLTLLREIRTGVTLPQQFEMPIAALARAQVWLRNVTNQELQAWRATDFPELTVEDRHQTGSERPAFDPWQQEELQAAGRHRLLALRGRGNRYEASQAESIVQAHAMRQDNHEGRLHADPIYWAGFQITGW